MTSDSWHELSGFDPDGDKFPQRAQMGEEMILVFKTAKGFRGVERACPHLKASLHDAILMANDTVLRCSLHNFTYKLSTGKGVNSPSFTLRVYEIKVEDGVGYASAAN